MAWMKLTHMVGKDKRDFYVNADQIVSVGDPVGAAPGSAAHLTLANGTVDVLETVEQVMGYVKTPNWP